MKTTLLLFIIIIFIQIIKSFLNKKDKEKINRSKFSFFEISQPLDLDSNIFEGVDNSDLDKLGISKIEGNSNGNTDYSVGGITTDMANSIKELVEYNNKSDKNNNLRKI